jgi:PIN domain nuclease of toxin-antitoxin system
VVSIWEVLVKSKRGGLTKVDSGWILKHVEDLTLSVLPLHKRHVVRMDSLPDHHKDPFDRMLICQALEEGVPMITCDAAIKQYPIAVIW